MQENELDKREGSPEGEEKKVSHCWAELRTDQSSQRERANVGQMQPGLGCGSLSPGVETRGEGWMRGLGLCFRGGQAKKKKKKLVNIFVSVFKVTFSGATDWLSLKGMQLLLLRS